MERREFISSLIAAAFAPSFDLEKYLWVPRKTIFIPANIVAPEEFTGLAIRSNDGLLMRRGLQGKYANIVRLLSQTNEITEDWKVDDAWARPSNFPVLSETNIYPAGSTAGLSGLMLSAAERVRERQTRPVFYMSKEVFDLQQEIAARKGWLHAFRRKVDGCR